jgi:molybdate transport system permease protein
VALKSLNNLKLKALASIATFIIVSPLVALLTRVPWSTLFSRLADPDSISAIRLSLWSSFLAAVISLFFGVPLGWILARSKNKFSSILRPIVLSPIVLPPTVAGLALLALLGRNGLLGQVIYNATGWAMPFTTVAVVFAGVFVGMPFLVLISESTFRQLPTDVEDAAVIDRVSEFKLFSLIALPQARSGIATGFILAWARAIGEFGATLMFAGSMPGITQTWTMQVYHAMDVDLQTAYALSVVMLLLAVAVMFALRKQIREAFKS